MLDEERHGSGSSQINKIHVFYVVDSMQEYPAASCRSQLVGEAGAGERLAHHDFSFAGKPRSNGLGGD
jgi:hypothetical protein